MEQKTIENEVHIGKKIAEVLKEKNMRQADLGRLLGVQAASVSYMIDRDTMDVKQLVRVGRLLKHNFAKYYYVDDGSAPQSAEAAAAREETARVRQEKDGVIEGLKEKIAGLEKEIERLKVDAVMKENEWLRKINGLLEKK